MVGPVFATLQRVLENTASRIVLSAAIVLSLVPHTWMHANDAWFMVLFGPEVLARTLLACRRESLPVAPGRRQETGWRAPSANEVGLLLLDLVALVSFIPVVASTFVSSRWLRLFRLSRTVLLLRYWAPVVNDLWTVTRRPERRRQIVFIFGSLLVVCFAGAVLLDHITTIAGDDFDGDGVVGDPHDHEFLVRMWWAFRQVEDPGNLLANPHDTGTLVVSVGLTLAGLFIISFIIGIGSDVVGDLSSLGRIRSPGLRGHTVIVNATPASEGLLRELLHEEFKLLPAATHVAGARWFLKLWRNLRTSRAFVVVGRSADGPDFLSDNEFSSVVYRAWQDDDDDTLVQRADLLNARRVVLLASPIDEEPDDDTIRMSLSVVEQLRHCEDDHPRHLLVEIIGQGNLPAAKRAISRSRAPLQADLVPTEALIVHCLAAVCRYQGLAQLLTALLRSEGRELYAWERELDSSGASLSSCAGPAPLAAMAHGANTSKGHASGATPVAIIVPDGSAGTRALINPGIDLGEHEVRGVIALADSSAHVAELVADFGGQAPMTPSVTLEHEFQVEAAQSLRRILVCGFRAATVLLLESLLREVDEQVLVHLLVADQESREHALLEFAAQEALVRQGLHGTSAGSFTVEDDHVYWLGQGELRVELHLSVGDWTTPRSMGELPGEVPCAVDFDLILFSADRSGESDARNTTGLMTLEALAESRPTPPRPRIVAEVDDVELAQRLNDRFESMGRPEVQVFSTEELHALVVFQSMEVRYFASILEELVASTNHRLVPLRVSGGGGTVAYTELSETLRAQGRILLAIERDDERGVQLGHTDKSVDLAHARLWVIDAQSAT